MFKMNGIAYELRTPCTVENLVV